MNQTIHFTGTPFELLMREAFLRIKQIPFYIQLIAFPEKDKADYELIVDATDYSGVINEETTHAANNS